MTATSLFQPDLKIAADEKEFSEFSAAIFIQSLEGLKSPLVVLPTGNTPLGMYEVLSTQYAHRRDLWDQMRFLQLDEYAGLSDGDHRLFSEWVSRVFLDNVGVSATNRTMFCSNSDDPVQEISQVEAFLAANGPIDLSVLGLGVDGHLGMNFPGTAFDAGIHLATLPPDVIRANAAYWGDEAAVPRQAYTLGLKNLLQSNQILLLVKGAAKSEILEKTLNGPVSMDIPATSLRTRGGVSVIADKVALRSLII